MRLYTTTATERRTGIDMAAVREQRRQRCFETMERHAVDILMLNRPGNSRYATGATGIAIVVGPTREHYITLIFNDSDDSLPPEFPFDHIIGATLNPMTRLERIAPIIGKVNRPKIGTDIMSPMLAQMLSSRFPDATLVDAEPVMREMRSIKQPGEIECLRLATGMAEAAMGGVFDALRPGLTEFELWSLYLEGIAHFGTTMPPIQGMFCVSPKSASEARALPGTAPMRTLPGDRLLIDGDLVNMSCGITYMGYESDIGRTWPAILYSTMTPQQSALHGRWIESYESLAEQCRPGKSARDLRGACDKLPTTSALPVVHGLGLGWELPIVGAMSTDDGGLSELRPGMVLVLQPYVWEEGIGGYLAKETLLITEGGHERLTALPYGPLAEE